MLLTSSVVVGYDGSGRAASALMWATREAADRGLTLHVIRAIPYAAASARAGVSTEGDHHAGGDRVLDEGIRLAGTHLDQAKVSGASITGHPAAVLTEASTQAALVVVGQRSQDDPVSSAIDSTSLVLADRACCPVVVARGATGPERGRLPIVVAVTGGASSQAALDFASGTAQIRGVPLTIVAPWSLPPAREWAWGAHGFPTAAQWARDLSARAEAVVAAAEEHVRQHHPNVTTQTRVEQLDPAAALVRSSRRAGLVVVGFAGGTARCAEGSAPTRELGHVARTLLGSASCPVVVVPDHASTTDDVATLRSDRGTEAT